MQLYYENNGTNFTAKVVLTPERQYKATKFYSHDQKVLIDRMPRPYKTLWRLLKAADERGIFVNAASAGI